MDRKLEELAPGEISQKNWPKVREHLRLHDLADRSLIYEHIVCLRCIQVERLKS